MSRDDHLVTVEQLTPLLGSVRLLDVRWHLTDAPGAGRERYAAGHLPGAQFLDLEAVLTAHTGDPRDGRHPLPEIAAVEEGLMALGVTSTDDLVVYDEPGSFAAERAWWVLRWAGLRPRVLDGGLTAWVDAGGVVETGEPVAPQRSVLHLPGGHLPTLDADGAARFPIDGVLLDARSPERFRGEVEPLDPKAGHIPGAANLPAAGLFTPHGRLPATEELRERLPSGEQPVAAYCGSGVSAARDILALAVVGIEAALYPGSWSAWSNDPGRPVATGPEVDGPTLDNGR